VYSVNENITDTETMNNNDTTEKSAKKIGFFAKLPSFFAVKMISFLGMFFSVIAFVVCAYVALLFWSDGIYRDDKFDQIIYNRYLKVASMNANQALSYLDCDEINDAVGFLKDRNVAVMEANGEGITFKYYRNPEYKENVPYKYAYSGNRNGVDWKIYVVPELEEKDAYYNAYVDVVRQYELRYQILIAALIAMIVLIISTTSFIQGIGRKSGSAEIRNTYLTKIPFDVVSLFTIILIGLTMIIAYILRYFEFAPITGAIVCILFVFLWVVNLIHRIKLGNVFRNTLIVMLFSHLSLLWQSAVILIILSTIEFFMLFFLGIVTYELEYTFVLLVFWFIEKCIVIPVSLYIVLMIRTLFNGGKKIAAGNLDDKINVSLLIGDFRKHGNNLNGLSEVINKSVSEKMKSERMKTELVTNVSHDLKTPLTSVINYSDLIRIETDKLTEDLNYILTDERYTNDRDNTDTSDVHNHLANISEYSGVLNRQSNKLKRLLDDLVDISKATSGNMEVIYEKINVATILSQAIGEYEERFEEKKLEVLVNGTDEDMYVRADSRKLWRVFDNLLQNIYKYALDGTRVYFSAERTDDKVVVVFRNTSRDIIRLSSDELTERFTRTDESRHMEGNGLGLAIAKSMIEVQEGEFKLDVDGDLFKVTLTLNPYIEEPVEVTEDVKTEEIVETADADTKEVATEVSEQAASKEEEHK